MESSDNVSVLDVFDYLEANGFKGLITAQDRETNKTILFAEEAIYVLSKGRRKGLRLVEVFRKEDSIDKQDIEDALADQRASNYTRSFGEVLVDEGVVSEKVLNIKKKAIVADEIYDLFLWKGAQFSFDPSATFESTFEKTDIYTDFPTDPVEYGQSVMDDLSDWDLTPEKIPDLTTIFVLDDSQFGRLKDLGLSRKMIQESQLFGENSVQEIFDQTSLNKRELCVLIFTLLRENILTPMDLQQAKQLAVQCENQGAFGKASTFYTYVILSGVPDVGAMRKLVDIMDKANRRHEAIQLLDNLGWSFHDDGKFINAINVAELILEYTPGYQSALTLLFHCQAQLANQEEVFKVGSSLGDLLVSKNKLSEALEHYNYLLQWFPDDLNIQCALADTQIKAGNTAEGIRILSECGSTYESQGKTDEALRTYKQILDVDESQEDVRKKVRSMERARFLKKFSLVGIPILLVVVIFAFYLWRATVKEKRKTEASKLFTKARKMESELPKFEEITKELDNIVDQDKLRRRADELRGEFNQPSRLFLKIMKDFDETPAYEDAKDKQIELKKRFARLEKIVEKRKKEILERNKRIEGERVREKRKIDLAKKTKKEGIELLEAGKYEAAKAKLKESFRHHMEFYNNFPSSMLIKSPQFRIPALIDSVPRGAKVYQGAELDETKFLGTTPFVHEYPAEISKHKLVLSFKTPGFKKLTTYSKDPQWRGKTLVWNQFVHLEPSLNMEPIWVYDILGAPVHSSYLYNNGFLYFTSRDGNIHGIKILGNQPQPNWTNGDYGYWGDFLTTPIKIRNLLFVANTSGSLVAFNINNQKKVWQTDTEGGIPHQPFVYQDPHDKNRYYIAFGNRGQYAHVYRVLFKKDKIEIRQYFSYKAENEIWAQPVIEGKYLYVAGKDNMLACFNYFSYRGDEAARLKSAEWVFEAPANLQTSPVLCTDIIIQACDDGSLYALDRKTGKLKWKVHLGEKLKFAPQLYPPEKMEDYREAERNFRKARLLHEREKLSDSQFEKIKKTRKVLKKKLWENLLVIVAQQNRIFALPLAKVAKQAEVSQSEGKTLVIKRNDPLLSWSQTLVGTIKEEPLLYQRTIDDKVRERLYVTTSEGMIYSYEVGKNLKESDMLKWKFQTLHLTSPVSISGDRLFFADKVQIQKQGKMEWDYRVNCLLLPK